MSDRFILRRAMLADITTLVRHRRWMFEDMSLTEGKTFAPADLDRMQKGYALHLEKHLNNEIAAWVAEWDGGIMGSGAVTFVMWPPGPFNDVDRIAHVHSLYTAPEARRQGVARAILGAAIDFACASGLHWVKLQASDEGRALYEKLGFTEARDEMLLGLGGWTGGKE